MSSILDDIGIEELDLELDPALLALLAKYHDAPEIDRITSVSPRILDESGNNEKKSWHTRRREEILRLREEVEALSLVLRDKRENPTSSLISRTGTPTFWENQATHEVIRLQKSTEENTRLLKLVRYRESQIKSLERAFKKRMPPAVRSPKTTEYHPSMFSENILTELTSGMDEIYANLDNFFTQIKMNELPCPGLRNDTTKYRDKNVFVNLLDCYALPFGLRETEKTVWNLKTIPTRGSNVMFAKYFDAGENTRMRSVYANASASDVAMQVMMHSAVRKYVEENRTIFISRSLIEPIQELFAVVFKETTRIVLKHGKPSATGPGRPIAKQLTMKSWHGIRLSATSRVGNRQRTIPMVFNPGYIRSRISITKWRISCCVRIETNPLTNHMSFGCQMACDFAAKSHVISKSPTSRGGR